MPSGAVEAMAPSSSSHEPKEAGAISWAITFVTLPLGSTKLPGPDTNAIHATDVDAKMVE
jgi:hypothetical protein